MVVGTMGNRHMLGGFAVLLVFQLIGEVIVRMLAIPVPGPVVGMLLLLSMLLVRGSVPAAVGESSRGLLRHLSLLFVPAGAGVLAHFPLIRGQFWAIASALFVSTVITMGVTALTMRILLRRGVQGPGR
jgi:holin-like protein